MSQNDWLRKLADKSLERKARSARALTDHIGLTGKLDESADDAAKSDETDDSESDEQTKKTKQRVAPRDIDQGRRGEQVIPDDAFTNGDEALRAAIRALRG